MKKFIYCLFVLFLLIFAIGCSAFKNTIVFLNEDGSVFSTIEAGAKEEVNIEAPTKEGYSFVGWYNNDQLVTLPTKFDADTTLSPKFEINIYKFTFLVDGVEVSSGELEYGSEIEYPKNPRKETSEGVEYTFKGWDNNATIITKDEIFNAVFESNKLKYLCIFYDGNDNILKQESLEYGDKINYPDNVTKNSSQQYSYEFIGWDKSDEFITENIVISPIFKEVLNKYTYKFLDDNGNVIKEELVDYGTMPVEPTAPTKDGYLFVGWDKAISEVVEDVTYTAKFSEPITSLEGKKLSILGDSISSFYLQGSEMNSYYSGENQFYYPLYSATIKTVDKTWWYQLLKNTNMTLGINNSWSGSCAYGTSSSAGCSDARINTIDENGTPDIVIIYLGTNDCASGFATEAFIGAIKEMITKVRAKGVNNIFITTLGYSAYKGASYKEETRLSYNEQLRIVAKENNCGIIPLDDYITETSYSFYLGDNLHYNAKGATLLSKIYEKSMKEYYGIEYNEKIEVENKEPLPEGVIGKVTVSSNTNFWGNYASHVFLVPASFTNPQYSHRIQLKFDSSKNCYVVTSILKSGDGGSFDCDYVIIISDAHTSAKSIMADLEKVVVGSTAEFNPNSNFPFDIYFK